MKKAYLAAALLTFIFHGVANAQSWYDDKDVRCVGPGLLDTSGLLPSSLPLHVDASGVLRAVLFGPAQFTALLAAKEPLAVDARTLTEQDVANIQQQIDEGKLAIEKAYMLKGSADTLAGLLPAGGDLVGFITDWLTKNADKKAVSLDALYYLLEEGATIQRQVKFLKDGASRHAIINEVYTVDVEDEERAILLSSCVAPAALKAIEFKTDVEFNNKIFSEDGLVWRMWDITDSKFDPWVYRLDRQSVTYYEFTEVEPPPNGDFLLMRINIEAGTMERKRPEWPDFKGFYEKIAPTR